MKGLFASKSSSPRQQLCMQEPKLKDTWWFCEVKVWIRWAKFNVTSEVMSTGRVFLKYKRNSNKIENLLYFLSFLSNSFLFSCFVMVTMVDNHISKHFALIFHFPIFQGVKIGSFWPKSPILHHFDPLLKWENEKSRRNALKCDCLPSWPWQNKKIDKNCRRN